MFSSNDELVRVMWFFTGGAILVLLQSILQGTKRSAFALLVGCLFGGIGSFVASQVWIASGIWAGNTPVIFIVCGIAAVITENMLLGFANASKEFSIEPVKTFSHFWRMMMPSFGKTSGDPQDDLK